MKYFVRTGFIFLVVVGGCATFTEQDRVRLRNTEARLEAALAKLERFEQPDSGCLPDGGGLSLTETLDAHTQALSRLETKIDKLEKKAPSRPSKPSGPDRSKTYAMPLEGAAQQGPDDAWVTVVEYSDFQCPFCSRVVPTLNKLREKHGDDLRLVFKHNPLSFHKNAMPAAIAAECAGKQGQFWPFHDFLFDNQRELTRDNFLAFAGQRQMRRGDFESCLDDESVETFVKKQQATGNAFGARGTPAFFINGRYLSGAQPLDAFDTLVKEELSKAKKSGIAAKDYYQQAVVKGGAEPR